MGSEQKINQKSIPVTIDKSHLITIGEKLYTEKMSFIRELVNNAYDADAREVKVDITAAAIAITDNGSGMDEQGLRQYFTIGSGFKKDKNTSPVYGRRRIGEFGIGKFSALAICKKFEIDTQKDDFHAKLIFDKEEWSLHEDWHLNIDILTADPNRKNGTLITLRDINTQFHPTRVKRYLAERTPIQAPDFAVIFNGEKISETEVTGKQLIIHSHLMPYGIVSGELTVVPSSMRLEKPGVAVAVKGVTVRRETFGLETSRQSGATRITGRVNADFLPITSGRDDFLRDEPAFAAFFELMKKEVHKALKLVKNENDSKANQQASRVLKDALSKIGRAMKNYGDVFPGAKVPMNDGEGGKSEIGVGYEISQAQFVDSGDKLNPGLENKLGEQKKGKKTRRSAILGDKSVIRSLKVGDLQIAVRMEHLGTEDESVVAGGVIYINLDHPLYRTWQKEDAQLTQNIARIITKELALQTGVQNVQEAFQIQTSLLTDALKEK